MDLTLLSLSIKVFKFPVCLGLFVFVSLCLCLCLSLCLRLSLSVSISDGLSHDSSWSDYFIFIRTNLFQQSSETIFLTVEMEILRPGPAYLVLPADSTHKGVN